MEDTTTTEPIELDGTGAGSHEGMAVDDQGNALTEEQVKNLAQPEPVSAEAEPVDNSTEPDKVESAVTVDQDLLDWAKKKGGFDTDDLSPGAVRALEIARQTEQEFHARNQKQSELKRSLEQPQYQPPAQPQPQFIGYDEAGQPMFNNAYQQPVQQQAPTVDPTIAMLKFQVEHKDYEIGSDLDQEMGKIVSENPLFWASHLDQAYDVAKAHLSGSDVESRIEQARRDERERLTKKSALSQPSAQATTQPVSTSIRSAAEAERFIQSASKDEYNERLPDLEKALGIELRPRK